MDRFCRVVARAGVAATVLLGALQARADLVYSYNGFSSTTGLTFVGDTATTNTSDGTVLRITQTGGNYGNGAAYSTTPVVLGPSDTFSTQFQFRFTNPGGIDPADGITFVLAASPTGLGGSGYGMGYQGVNNSVAIEFDTYNNTGYGLGNDDGNSSNHVSIDENGVLTNLALNNVYGNGSCGFPGGSPGQNNYAVPGCMSNGDLWTVKVSYDGSKLNVTLDDPLEGTTFNAISDYSLDVASLLGTDNAYVGFTGSTGAGWENEDIVNWQFANTSTLPSTAAPEPAEGLLMGAGLTVIGLAWRRFKK